MNVLGWVFDILMTPFDWAVTQTVVFAVTATDKQIYIAMGIATVILIALIYSMIPKKAKVAYEPIVFALYQATEEDEKEARQILTGVQAI